MKRTHLLVAILVALTVAAGAVWANQIVNGLNTQLKQFTIKFDHDSYKFEDPKYITIMDAAAPAIKGITTKMPDGYSLYVIGHASEDGSEAYNEHLSNWRARTVYWRLGKSGVAEKRMEWIGNGEKADKRAVTFEIRPTP